MTQPQQQYENYDEFNIFMWNAFTSGHKLNKTKQQKKHPLLSKICVTIRDLNIATSTITATTASYQSNDVVKNTTDLNKDLLFVYTNFNVLQTDCWFPPSSIERILNNVEQFITMMDVDFTTRLNENVEIKPKKYNIFMNQLNDYIDLSNKIKKNISDYMHEKYKIVLENTNENVYQIILSYMVQEYTPTHSSLLLYQDEFIRERQDIYQCATNLYD